MTKLLIWLAGIIGVCQLLGLVYLLSPPNPSTDRGVRFEYASRCEEKPSANPLNGEGIANILDQPMPDRKDCWQQVTLPDLHPVQDIKLDLNDPQLVRTWYRVRYLPPKHWPIAKPLMVFVPRTIANAWQIRIAGQPIADNRFDWRSTWNHPVSARFFLTNGQLGHPVDVDVGVIASIAEGVSIGRISVGDANTIGRQKAIREYMQVIMPQAVSAVLLLMGFFFLSFWLARRSETEYLYLAFASLAFAIFNLKYALTQPEDPASDYWFNVFILDSPTPWIHSLEYLFISRFAKFSFPWMEKLLWSYIILFNLITFSPISLQYDLSLIKGVIGFSIANIGHAIVVWQAVVSRNFELRIIAVVLVFGILFGFHDLGLHLNLINPEGLYIGPYSGLALSACFVYVIQRRYAAAIASQEQLNLVLANRLSELENLTRLLTKSEMELRTQQSRLLEFERTQTLIEERQRLMHDMHDGLGSSLLTTLAAIEKNTMPQQAVAEALRACIDDLRLVIDSLEPTANDLATLLGTIRYRLGQRLTKAGLELQWEINDLPPLPWLEPPDALNVLRLMQEALVNVLKHANASSIRVSTRDLGDSVEIQIDDNGCGYDPTTVTLGRGMPSQAKRAERLGGVLKTESIVGRGTSIRLILPVQKTA